MIERKEIKPGKGKSNYLRMLNKYLEKHFYWILIILDVHTLKQIDLHKVKSIKQNCFLTFGFEV